MGMQIRRSVPFFSPNPSIRENCCSNTSENISILGITILGPSITSTFIGLTRIRSLSCGFDSLVGGRGFESRSEPEFFQVSVLVVLRPHLH